MFWVAFFVMVFVVIAASSLIASALGIPFPASLILNLVLGFGGGWLLCELFDV